MPTASRPRSTRRTIAVFSLLSKTVPRATRRRISRPEAGLAMMPTSGRDINKLLFSGIRGTRYRFLQLHIMKIGAARGRTLKRHYVKNQIRMFAERRSYRENGWV